MLSYLKKFKIINSIPFKNVKKYQVSGGYRNETLAEDCITFDLLGGGLVQFGQFKKDFLMDLIDLMDLMDLNGSIMYVLI